MDPKISVIIPTYKPGPYLKECLTSIENQTLNPALFETILVLNGPADPYRAEIDDIVRDFKTDIRVIATDTPGVSNARNIGIESARGEYLTFIDDDDYVSPTYLEELSHHASPDVIALSNAVAFIDGSGKIVDNYILTDSYRKRASLGRQRYENIRGVFSVPWMKLIHRDIIGDRRFNTRFSNGEDALFNFLISDRISFVDFTSPDAVIYHRKARPGSLTGNLKFNRRQLRNNFALMAEYTRIFFGARGYSFKFYTTRVLAIMHTILNTLKYLR